VGQQIVLQKSAEQKEVGGDTLLRLGRKPTSYHGKGIRFTRHIAIGKTRDAGERYNREAREKRNKIVECELARMAHKMEKDRRMI
jgi:hypothetical protein